MLGVIIKSQIMKGSFMMSVGYKELTKKEAHDLSVKYQRARNDITVNKPVSLEPVSLEREKQKITRSIYSLSSYGFSVTMSVFKNNKCRDYLEQEDILMENYKDIKKWLKSLGYRVELFPSAWVPCKEHFLTIEW